MVGAFMPELQITGRYVTGNDAFDDGVNGLVCVETSEGTLIATLTGVGGGVATYLMNSSGVITAQDSLLFDANSSWALGAWIDVLNTDQGARLMVTGPVAGTLLDVGFDAFGTLGSFTSTTLATSGPHQIAVQTGSGYVVSAASGKDGFDIYSQATNGPISLVSTVTDSTMSFAQDIGVMSSMTLGGNVEIVMVGSQSERGLSSYVMTNGTATLASSLEYYGGIPTAMASAVKNGGHYTVLASAAGSGQDGTLTVVRTQADGSMVMTDQVMDTLDTRFGRAQAVDTLEINGHTFVVAGGADSGISLFLLMPDGTLHYMQSLESTIATSFASITDITLSAQAGMLYGLISTAGGKGIIQVEFDVSAFSTAGAVIAGDGSLVGGAQHDVLEGDAQNNAISGGLGDDIIRDGAGSDALSGGDGSDVFVLAFDGELDTITDFNPLEDKLDLSHWSFLYDASSLTIEVIQGVFQVTWRDERLDLLPANGVVLTEDDIRDAVVLGPNRTIIPDNIIFGEVGTAGDDIIYGTPDADNIDGGGGDDKIYGDDGDDTITGGTGDDIIYGDSGGGAPSAGLDYGHDAGVDAFVFQDEDASWNVM